MSYPAQTTDGRIVRIVSKVARANEPTLLVDKDGNEYTATTDESLTLAPVEELPEGHVGTEDVSNLVPADSPEPVEGSVAGADDSGDEGADQVG